MGQDNVNAIIAGVVPALVLALLGFGSRGQVGPGQLRYSRIWRGFSLFIAIVPPLGVLALALFQKKPFEPGELATVIGLALLVPALSAPLEAHGEARAVLLVMASGKGSDLLTSPLPPAQILTTPRR